MQKKPIRTGMYEHRKNINKERKNRKKFQIKVIELENIIAPLKNTLEGFNNRLVEIEEIY